MEFNLYVNGNIHKCDEERVWESFQNGKKIRANFVELSCVIFLFKRQDKMVFSLWYILFLLHKPQNTGSKPFFPWTNNSS